MDNNLPLVNAWISKAKHDIGMAKLAITDGCEFTDSICYHCQQYAEKIIKAQLIKNGVEAPKTHSLSYLLDLLADNTIITDVIYDLAETLEDYAVGVRYPADDFEPTADDAKTAYKAAIEIGEFFNA